MMFKDLQKLVSQQQRENTSKELFQRLQGKPFWIWNVEEHKLEDAKTNGNCCFNHIIGLPTKEGIEKAIFDYEKLLYYSLLDNESYNAAFTYKHLWVKKATGLGVTEFFLRLMAWLSLRNNDYQNSQMCVVTGPNIDIAIKLIKRMKGLFEPKLGITFDSKETVLELNGCIIEAYPSNHIDAYRALENPKFILIDEGDFFRKGEQEDVRHVSERYIAKSDPYIVMLSNPQFKNDMSIFGYGIRKVTLDATNNNNSNDNDGSTSSSKSKIVQQQRPYSKLRMLSGACVGRDTCRLTYTDSEKFEPYLIDQLEDRWGDLNESIGVTGCEKQCYRPATKTVGWIGTGFNLYQLTIMGTEDGRHQGGPLIDPDTKEQYLR